jgi:hypothetical protein
MGRYTDYVKMLIEKPELSKIRNFRDSPWSSGSKFEKLSEEDEVVSSYLLLGYGIFEEVFLLHKRKWIDDHTWEGWSAFLQNISRHPLFRRVHEVVSGPLTSSSRITSRSFLEKRTQGIRQTRK